MKIILVLAANPTTAQLQLDEEVRNIRAALERSKDRDRFKLETRSAVRWKDVRRAIEDLQPEVVHFSGHGAGEEGLLLEDEEGGGVRYVSADALRRMFELFPCVECVVLNACYSEVQARAIYRHVSCVIGMSLSVGDRAARDFAEAFYDGLGAGRVYGEAFDLGLSGIANDVEVWTPMRLWRKTEQPTQAIELEQPGSRMSVESKFYVMRSPAETDAAREVVKPGALIRIKAPHEFGKSSLMGRVVAQAEACGAKTVAINFREIDREAFESLKSFLHYFCLKITRKLRFDNKISDYWEYQGPKADCAEYFEDYLLPQIGNALVLELDEVDLLFDESLMRSQDMIDFFGMLRAWHDSKKEHPQWRKLKLVLVHCQDVPHEKFPKSQSPFNVGTEVDLVAFSLSQVQDLAVRHGLDQAIASGLMALVGGHPQLVRLGLYAIARGESLETLGATEAGLYGSHLRRVRSKLEGHPELKMAFQRVLAGEKIDQSSSAALRSLGVGKLRGNKVEVTCELYRQYFRSVWS